MVRADPDVIMVGEIRDCETAKIAIEAALTGHLVLSTLHTNDAPTAITRLLEMGIEPFLVASAVDCVVAQRLARSCARTASSAIIIPPSALHESGYKVQYDLEAYEPAGCSAVRELRLQGPDRPVRGDDDARTEIRDWCSTARPADEIARGRRATGHEAPA